jgi:hypothetical protein
MKKPTKIVKDILDAIRSVRLRAKRALDGNDQIAYSSLMGDLYALEACLVIETEKLVNYLDKKAA